MKRRKTIITVGVIALLAVIGTGIAMHHNAANSSKDVHFGASGKVCSYTVGCGCTGFQRGSGDHWEKEYCKKCHHHRKFHH